LKLILAAFLLITATLPAFAQEDAVTATIRKYGFEPRNGEIPWGVPITANLTVVKHKGKEDYDDAAYKIDLSTPLSRGKLDEFMAAYIAKYGVKEVALESAIFGPKHAEAKYDLDALFVDELKLSIYPPPELYLAVTVREIGNSDNRIRCNFHFVKYEDKYYLEYFKASGYDTTFRTTEPHCEPST
jgi:hypothetical protein